MPAVSGAGDERGGARRTGLAAIVATAVLWGTTGTAATFAPDVPALAIGAAALGVGGLLQGLIALPALLRDAPALRGRWRIVLLGAVSVAVYPLAFYTSMRWAGVAVGTVVSLASAPLCAALLERVVDHRRLGPDWLMAAALGIAGALLLVLAGSDGDPAVPVGRSGGSVPAGVALGLVAGATYALYSWVARRLMRAGLSRSASMGAVFGGGGLLLVPVLAATGAPILASSQNLAVAAYMAVVPMFLGYVLFGVGLSRVDAGTATTLTLVEPAVATILAVLVVGERLGVAGWAGLALIAAALVALVIAPLSRARSRPAG